MRPDFLLISEMIDAAEQARQLAAGAHATDLEVALRAGRGPNVSPQPAGHKVPSPPGMPIQAAAHAPAGMLCRRG